MQDDIHRQDSSKLYTHLLSGCLRIFCLESAVRTDTYSDQEHPHLEGSTIYLAGHSILCRTVAQGPGYTSSAIELSDLDAGRELCILCRRPFPPCICNFCHHCISASKPNTTMPYPCVRQDGSTHHGHSGYSDGPSPCP